MDQLGIEPKLLFAQVVNFTIIVVVLTKLLFRPVLTMIEKRKKEIEEGLTLTETLRKEEEKLSSKRESVMEAARSQAGTIIEEAKQQAKVVEKDILAAAHVQAGEILEKAKRDGVAVKQQLMLDVGAYGADHAVTIAKRLLSTILSSKEQHALIQKHIRDIELFAKKKQSKEGL